MVVIGTDIKLAKELLEKGQLVAVPTETVYGLAANGLDEDAVLKIYEAKKRPSFNPLILHVSGLAAVKKLVSEFPEPAALLAEKFWPGPLTLVLKKKNIVPDIVTAGLDTVAIRMPRHPLTQRLLHALDFPLAAPSANPSGYISPTSSEHVAKLLGNKVAYILDGGRCEVGIESTIVKVSGAELTVLRLGGLELEDIEKTVGGDAQVRLGFDHSKVESPGMTASHYAPVKKMVVGDIEENMHKYSGKKIGVLRFKSDFGLQNNVQARLTLSESGDLHEAARNLFSYLRALDSNDNVEIILSELAPDEGLGRAINDRLRRAATGS